MSSPTRTRPQRAATRWSVALGVVAAVVALVVPAASGQDDPALDQVIDGDQEVVTGRVELSDGHVDIGPRIVEGEWRLMVHDDTVDPSVWRPLDDVVFRVSDDALVEFPDDPVYSFVGAEPGAQVHVVSQTQVPGVVWIGWNTQDPAVMQQIDRGVTLTMLGVQGPGRMSVYLQSGNFGDPDVLWSSAERGAQTIWVDVNTHTHANWVFTEPGVHLVRVRLDADLVDGSQVDATGDLRVVVGDDVDLDEAFEVAADPAAFSQPASADAQDEASEVGAEPDDRPVVALVAGGVVVALVVGLAAVVLADRRARRRALDARRDEDVSAS